jgi:hypothetical protein
MNRFTDSHVVFFPRLKSWGVIFEKLRKLNGVKGRDCGIGDCGIGNWKMQHHNILQMMKGDFNHGYTRTRDTRTQET